MFQAPDRPGIVFADRFTAKEFRWNCVPGGDNNPA